METYQIDNIPSQIDFKPTDSVMRVLQNAKNLLMCKKGEVPYDRSRGFNPALYDLPIDELRRELMPELDRVMIWEPGVSVVSAEATILKDGSVYIKAILNVLQE